MTEVTSSNLGHRASGEEVTTFQLSNDMLSVEVWDYGATLVSVQFDGVNMVQGRGTLADYDSPDRGGYMGHTIGRYANRIAGGRFSIDGTSYQVDTNDGQNALHGGAVGFDQTVWSGEAIRDQGRVGVRFRHVSLNGDQGFPGTVEASVVYWLDGSTLTFEYEATTDAPTIVNLTNHAYWNLAGRGTIDDHELSVSGSRWLDVDDHSIPTDLRDVAGTRFDLRQPVRIGDERFDHCWVLDEGRPAAMLRDPQSGRSMTVMSDQPGLQVYTGDHLSMPFRGVALETQHLPNAPNRPDFGNAILRPGEVYRHETSHQFG